MNLGLWPEAVPFDPDDGAGSEELEKHLAEASFPGAALVVAGRGMHGSEWAPQAAIGLARALTASGRDVLLADLDFESPSLHELLSESAVEGLADVLLYGASLERVTVLPAGQSFEFVATGGYVPDPEALRGEQAWGRLLDGLAARETVFLGYTTFDAAGIDRLVERIPSIVLLSPPDDVAQTVARLPDQIRVEAMIRPPQKEAPDAGPAVAAGFPGAGDEVALAPTDGLASEVAGPEEAAEGQPDADAEGDDAVEASTADESRDSGAAEANAAAAQDSSAEAIRLPKDEAREALIADLEARERAARAQAEADEALAAEEPAAEAAGTGIDAIAEDVASRSRPKRKPWHWLAAAAVIIAGGGATWYFGFQRNADLDEPVQAPPQAALPQAPPEPVGEPLGWSVAIEAHDRIGAANQSAADLGVADSTIAFYVAPAVVNGSLWYRVLAGPLRDSLSAVQAMQRLVDSGLKQAALVSHVRQTDLTFLLGRFPLESEAAARLQEVRDLGVPAYVMEVPYSYGDPWYHVYGGAYSSPVEADAMRQLLLDAGLPDSLIVRTGRSAS